MDGAGRIVIPKAIRQAQGWTAGAELEIRAERGKIELEAPHVAMRLEPRGELWVAVKPGVPRWSAAAAAAELEALRNERGLMDEGSTRAKRPR